MKFYSKPEIEALALETVDVIETSGAEEAAKLAVSELGVEADEVQIVDQQISKMSTDWQW